MDFLDNIKRYAPILLIGLIVVILYFVLQKDEFSEEAPTADNQLLDDEDISVELREETEDIDLPSEILVDIKGEVKKPGVYQVQADERVQAVIDLAGGFTDEANVMQINLAQKVHDEMVIYVPLEGEDHPIEFSAGTTPAHLTNHNQTDLIKVNAATVDDLTKLNGIGPSKAQAILDYREEHGPFKQVEDLLEVNGIGEKTLDNIRDQLLIP